MNLLTSWNQFIAGSDSDAAFREEITELSRRGLRTAGLIGIVLPMIMVAFYVLILGLSPAWHGEDGVSTVIWDELLISCCAAVMLLLSSSAIGVKHPVKLFTVFFWLATAIILLDDLVQTGDIYSTNYLALLMLVAVGTVPCRAYAMVVMGLGMITIYLSFALAWPAPLSADPFIFLGTQAILAAWLADILLTSRQRHFEATRRIALSEQKYRSLFLDASDAIFVIDGKTGCFREVNPTLERLLGATAAELEKTPFERILHSQDRERVMEYHRARLRGEPAPDRYQLRIVAPSTGEEHICDIAIHRSADSGVTAGVVRDLTERVRAEETIRRYASDLEDTNRELHETQVRLVHAEKAAALSDLVAGVVHELNTPLAAILSNADVAVRATGQISQQRAVLGQLVPEGSLAMDRCCQVLAQACEGTKESVKRISQLVTTLKSFAHLDESEIQSINLNATITDAIVLLRRLGAPDVTIFTQFATLPTYTCVARDISQLVSSLIKRALTATPAGGEVNVTTLLQETNILLTVQNSGIALTLEQTHRLFDPRFAVKDDRVGLGLELPIALQIITAHGGSVDVTSDEITGTTINVTLPRCKFGS